MTAAGAALAVGAVMILAALALAAQSAYYRHRLAAADDTEHPDDVVVGHLRVPVLIAADGHAITPCEVAVVAHLLWHQLDTVANAMHAEAMAVVLDQVASDETRAGLDDALTRLTDNRHHPGGHQ